MHQSLLIQGGGGKSLWAIPGNSYRSDSDHTMSCNFYLLIGTMLYVGAPATIIYVGAPATIIYVGAPATII